MFSLSSTVFLVLSCWVSTLLYSLGTYLLISPTSQGPGVHSCRISSLPATPYLMVKPVLVILSSVLMFSMYIDILKRYSQDLLIILILCFYCLQVFYVLQEKIGKKKTSNLEIYK